jgi:hypothetical protein
LLKRGMTMATAIVPPIINPIIPNKILSKVIFIRDVFSALQVTVSI